MIYHDLTRWPLVITVIRGTPTADDQLDLFSKLGECLDRNEKFVTLRIYADVDSLSRPQGGSESKAWLQSNLERMREQIQGMARVVPPEIVEGARKGPNIGVPAEIFGHVEDALSWINDEVLSLYGDQSGRGAVKKSIDNIMMHDVNYKNNK